MQLTEPISLSIHIYGFSRERNYIPRRETKPIIRDKRLIRYKFYGDPRYETEVVSDTLEAEQNNLVNKVFHSPQEFKAAIRKGTPNYLGQGDAFRKHRNGRN